jgi:hypothetical protein
MEGNIRNVCGGMVARRMCRERSHTVTEKKNSQIALEEIANWPIRLLALLGCSRAVRDKVPYSRTSYGDVSSQVAILGLQRNPYAFGLSLETPTTSLGPVRLGPGR